MIGGATGFFGDMAADFAAMSHNPIPPGTPILSYGQEFGLITLPLCTFVGAGYRFAFFPAFAQQRFLSGMAFLFAGLSGIACILHLWSDRVAQYGRDRSELVLYHTRLALFVFGLLLGLSLLYLGIPPRRVRANPTDPQ